MLFIFWKYKGREAKTIQTIHIIFLIRLSMFISTPFTFQISPFAALMDYCYVWKPLWSVWRCFINICITIPLFQFRYQFRLVSIFSWRSSQIITSSIAIKNKRPCKIHSLVILEFAVSDFKQIYFLSYFIN